MDLGVVDKQVGDNQMAKNSAVDNCYGMLGMELGPQDIVSWSVAWRGQLKQVGFEGWQLEWVKFDVQQQVFPASPVPSTVLNLLVGSLTMTMLNPNQ